MIKSLKGIGGILALGIFMIQRIGTSNVPLLIIIEFILSLIISVCVSIGIKVIFKIGNNIRTQYKEKNKV